MVSVDREAVLRQLMNLSSESLAEMLRRRDTSRWREEVFEIAERILSERMGARRTQAAPQAAKPAAAPAARPSPQTPQAPATTATGPVIVGAPPAPAAQTQTSPVDFEEARSDAIAVVCSDGRFAQHFEHFLSDTLGMPRCDRLAVPGGPALLAGRLATFWESSGVENQMRFLVESHELRRIVLIAHEGCGYYARKLGLAPVKAEEAQMEDLQKAARSLVHLGLEVTAYMVRRHEGRIVFEPMALP